MFGIAEARAAENSSGESAKVPGDMSEMLPTYCEKRSRSPGLTTTPSAKRPKREDSTRDQDNKMSNEILPLPTFDDQYSPDVEKYVDEDTTKTPKAISSKIASTTTALTSEDKNETRKDEIQMKELRVVLRDIKLTNSRFNGTKNESNEGNLFEVDKILGKRMKNGVPLYFIKWKDWSSDSNTWEPVENLVNCSEMLERFEKERVQLLDNFKHETNFHPDSKEVENHMKELIKTNKPIDGTFTDQEDLYRTLKSFFHTRTSDKKREKLTKWIKRGILQAMFSEIRRDQLESLMEWESEINSITKGKPTILVENLADLESAPQDFLYIEEYLPGNGVIIPDEPPIGCDCENCDSRSKCCFAQYEGVFPYTQGCRVRVPPGTPIYECNKRCKCPADCKNRVVQRGSNVRLCVFRTFNGRGWGVKTLKLIKKGTFVTQYVGEVITNEEAEKRGKDYDAAGRTYLFDLDYNVSELGDACPYTVDAAVYGNVSHFINHSCAPNCAVYGVWVDCLDPNLPKLALFATRDIPKDEEITFDYMCQSSRNIEKNKNSTTIATSEGRQRLELPQQVVNNEITENKTRCKCGAEQCRQYLF